MPICARNLNIVKSKLLLDTNVLVDYMIPDRPEHGSAEKLIAVLAAGSDRGFVSTGTLKDCYYICCKYIGEKPCRELIRQFLIIFNVLALGPQECLSAAYSDEPDFEDGLIRAVAESNDMDFIITRDAGAFQRSTLKSLTAAKYLTLFGSGQVS